MHYVQRSHHSNVRIAIALHGCISLIICAHPILFSHSHRLHGIVAGKLRHVNHCQGDHCLPVDTDNYSVSLRSRSLMHKTDRTLLLATSWLARLSV